MALKLINRTNCKACALAVAGRQSRRFTRVSGEFLDELDAALRNCIEKWVHQAPSIGVTLYSPNKSTKKKETDDGA